MQYTAECLLQGLHLLMIRVVSSLILVSLFFTMPSFRGRTASGIVATPEQLILGQSGRSRQGDLVKGVDVRQLLAQGFEMRQAHYFHKGQMGNSVL